MKVAIIVDNYPNPDNLYANGFIHQRIKEYSKYFDCVVLNANTKSDFIYEEILVKGAPNLQMVEKILSDGSFDKIIIHFVKWWIVDYLIKKNKLPVLIWVHGYETLSWIRYYFDYKLISLLKPSFYIYTVLDNMKQRHYLRRIIKFSNHGANISFVFVSDWMKRKCECDTYVKVKFFNIIPNPININIFKPEKKAPSLAAKILLIRSFQSNKYANDIAIKSIEILSKSPIFNKLQFTIYGKGKHYKELTSKLLYLDNVRCINTFLSPTEIKQQHDKNGIFLCPTRMDAQGVSMCEAMASGLVIISSKNTAIPEFVDNNINGIITSGPKEIAKRIIELNANPEYFSSISQAASLKIIGKIDIETIIKKELMLIDH